MIKSLSIFLAREQNYFGIVLKIDVIQFEMIFFVTWLKNNIKADKLTVHWLTLDDENWEEVIDSLEMRFVSWLSNCFIGVNRSFSFRWNGSELSLIIQSPIRWVVTIPFDLLSNIFCFEGFSMTFTNGVGVGVDFAVWQYSIGHILSGMSVVVTRGVAENLRKIDKRMIRFSTY